MPIYEYRCEACHVPTEIMQKSTDPAPAACEKCGKGPMIKQLSLSSFALKGTGWYVTDFKGGRSSSAPSAPDSSSSTAAQPTASSSETSAKAAPSSGS
jgi:putative FmdB family regulatory protein